MSRLPLAVDLMQPIERLKDADGFLIHWTGGLQSAEGAKGQWRILPILHANAPHINGFYSRSDMQAFMRQRGVRFVAFQQISWTNGEYNGRWAPFIPGQSNFHLTPADMWSNVAGNLGRARTRLVLEGMQYPSPQDIEAVLDAQSEPERLARSISLSLRNLDNSVEQIASFYNQELTNFLAAGRLDGLHAASTRDQALYAMVHGFFLHLGAARDYLAAFVALQQNLDPHKTDSMAKLVETLRGPNVSQSGSSLLQLLESKGYIKPIGAPSTKWQASGWLEQATQLRNEFVHRRTYGHATIEKMGHLRPIDSDAGLYRYYRPISMEKVERDAFDVILDNYERVNELFFAAAEASGLDSRIPTVTDKDIISFQEAAKA